MKPLRVRQSPEEAIVRRIMAALRVKGWYVLRTHGNLYQSGLPDLYATHKTYGVRWIEVKLPDMKGSRFTRAQYDVFPKLVRNGTKVWILTSEEEYPKLFQPCNLWHYMRAK